MGPILGPMSPFVYILMDAETYNFVCIEKIIMYSQGEKN